MLIEIITKSVPYENSFVLYRNEFIDGEKTNAVKTIADCECQLESDLLNIGLSIKSLTEFNQQFGIEVKSSFRKRTREQDWKQVFFAGKDRFLAYTESNEKVIEKVYTENIEVFENFKYPMRFYESRKIRLMIARIKTLSEDNCITVTLPQEKMLEWQETAVKKYE